MGRETGKREGEKETQGEHERVRERQIQREGGEREPIASSWQAAGRWAATLPLSSPCPVPPVWAELVTRPHYKSCEHQGISTTKPSRCMGSGALLRIVCRGWGRGVPRGAQGAISILSSLPMRPGLVLSQRALGPALLSMAPPFSIKAGNSTH